MTDKEQEPMGRSHDDFMIEHLRGNPAFAVELLNVAIEENTPAELAIILRQIRAAGIRVSAVAPKPAPRKRARPVAAKRTKRLPAGRGRTRRSAAAIA